MTVFKQVVAVDKFTTAKAHTPRHTDTGLSRRISNNSQSKERIVGLLLSSSSRLCNECVVTTSYSPVDNS